MSIFDYYFQMMCDKMSQVILRFEKKRNYVKI